MLGYGARNMKIAKKKGAGGRRKEEKKTHETAQNATNSQ
jgi:hypothetical protein